MKKKHEEKILAAIRNKVIEKDIQRNSEEEIKEMQEANIEALTELTTLSRKEVEQIAEQVKKDFDINEKKKQKRIIQYSIFFLVSIIVLYFVFRPEPKLKERIVEDNFNDNSSEWSVINEFVYNRYFKDKQYYIELNNKGWCYWDDLNVDFPKNCDIEVASKWMNGKYSSYGLGLNQSDNEYFAFTIKGDGSASFGKVVNSKWVIDDANKYKIGNEGKNKTNIQKIEIRNKNFKYYVNDNLVRTGILDLDYTMLSLYGCGEQEVAFDYVKVTDTDTKNVIFTDDFSNPSNLWNPKKKFTCEANISNGKFVFNMENPDNCNWSGSEILEVTKNCEIELTSTWLTGELANYGFMILNDDENYYSLELQNNGVARFVERSLDKYTYVQDDVKTPFDSDGKKQNVQKAIIKDKKISYYVNNKLIKTYSSSLDYPCKIAIRACGKQTIAFEKLKIKYYE